MHHSTRAALASLAAAGVVLVPALALALSIDELQSQIQALLAQVKVLQSQIHEQMASSTPNGMHSGSTTVTYWPQRIGQDDSSQGEGGNSGANRGRGLCVALSRTLAIGSRGDDVRSLQQQLIASGDLEDSTADTGFFGQLTAAAVNRMQMRLGVASSTVPNEVVVGPRTRARLHEACGVGAASTSTPPMMPNGMPGHMNDDVPLQANMLGGQDGHAMTGGSVSGTITTITQPDSIMVTDPSGTSRTISITSTTLIKSYDADTHTMTDSSLSDLSVGDTIVAHGLVSGGSLQAVLIQKGLPLPNLPNGVNHPSFMQGFSHGGDDI